MVAKSYLGEKDESAEHRGFFTEFNLHNTIIMGTCHYTVVISRDYTILGVIHNVNYGLCP